MLCVVKETAKKRKDRDSKTDSRAEAENEGKSTIKRKMWIEESDWVKKR